VFSSPNIEFSSIGLFNFYHPALHFLTYILNLILTFFHFSPKTIQITQILNIIISSTTLFLLYYFISLLHKNRTVPILVTLSVAFSNVYWYESIASEVHLASNLFFVIIAILFVKILNNLSEEKKIKTYIIYVAFALVGAILFHLLAGLFGLVVIFFLGGLKNNNINIAKLIVVGVLVTFLSLFILYVVPIFYLYKLHSLKELISLLTFYSNNGVGIWQNPENITTVIMNAFVTSISSFAISIVNFNTKIYFQVICIIFLFYFALVKHNTKNLIHKVLLFWFVSFFLIFTIIMPDCANYWNFLIIPFFSFVILVLYNNTTKWIFFIMVVLIFVTNFYSDIYPKSKVSINQFNLIKNSNIGIKDINGIIFLCDSNFFATPEQRWLFYDSIKTINVLDLNPASGDFEVTEKDFNKILLPLIVNFLQKNNKILFFTEYPKSNLTVLKIRDLIKTEKSYRENFVSFSIGYNKKIQKYSRNLTSIPKIYKAEAYLYSPLKNEDLSDKDILINAIREGLTNYSTKLIKSGIDLNYHDSLGNTALHVAVNENNYKISKILLDQGAQVNIKNNDKVYPLHKAAKFASPGIVKLLLDYGADVNCQNRWLDTPLHDAYFNKQYKKNINVLLTAGADANIKNYLGISPKMLEFNH